mmetsp:Transcript_27741/g.60664  ORF Transcript_27741/g.60664 Transcript_27741/m.60664 type:complete len:156 (+) Transcript_27741:42-509(+)
MEWGADLPDDGRSLPEDLSALLAEGASASVAELCASGPSAAMMLGAMLVMAAVLIVAIRFTWASYSADITAFYLEAAADGDGPLADKSRREAPGASQSTTASPAEASPRHAEGVAPRERDSQLSHRVTAASRSAAAAAAAAAGEGPGVQVHTGRH